VRRRVQSQQARDRPGSHTRSGSRSGGLLNSFAWFNLQVSERASGDNGMHPRGAPLSSRSQPTDQSNPPRTHTHNYRSAARWLVAVGGASRIAAASLKIATHTHRRIGLLARVWTLNAAALSIRRLTCEPWTQGLSMVNHAVRRLRPPPPLSIFVSLQNGAVTHNSRARTHQKFTCSPDLGRRTRTLTFTRG
jgi:hypothetical protein